MNYPENKTEINSYGLPFTNIIYIDQSDFKTQYQENFYGLILGKRIRLRYSYIIECIDFETDTDNKVILVRAKYITESVENSKGILHWVASDHITAEIRLYNTLFNTEFPGKSTGNFLDDINNNSFIIKQNCLLDIRCKVKPFDKFQLERIGYFCVDKDSTEKNIILNLIVSLKEFNCC